MSRLIVYLNGKNVGILEENDSRLQFRYRPEWLAAKEAYPLSKALPLQQESFEKQSRPFFAGILPKAEPRRKIAAVLGISAGNDFAMLARIGGECAGAVSLLPEDAPPPSPTENRLRRLSPRELTDIIAELPRRPLLAGEKDLRLSLAGAQDKLPVHLDAEGFALPLGNTPSSHIIKPEPQRFPGLTANETFCMRLARAAGLTVPDVEMRRAGDTPYIIVKRYDRCIRPDGTIERIHQEDFCQALGFPPERKYQQEGGPRVRDCFSLLREWSSTPVLDIREFVDGLVFNSLVGNADAHGKNFSMLYQNGTRRLAPFYDIVCTLAWPELSGTPAMKLGTARSINDLTLTHFQRMAEESQLGWPSVRERIAKLSQRIRNALDRHSLDSVAGDAVASKVAKLISDRTDKMLNQIK